MAPHHENTGKCQKCAEIFDRYPNFFQELRSWFENLQVMHPDAHISCAGRGKLDQEACFKAGVSNAHWGMSAHNYNCAIDIFQDFHGATVYDHQWFDNVVRPNLTDVLAWYGLPDAVYHELPHVEIKAWRDLKAQKLIELVESVEYKDDHD